MDRRRYSDERLEYFVERANENEGHTRRRVKISAILGKIVHLDYKLWFGIDIGIIDL